MRFLGWGLLFATVFVADYLVLGWGVDHLAGARLRRAELALDRQERTLREAEVAAGRRSDFEAEVRRGEQKLAELADKFGKKPNVLIFIVDDMGWGDPGCYGGGLMSGAPTPNIDSLASEGLRLTSTYAQPTCSPTRATLMTGRLPIRTGMCSDKRRVLFPNSNGGLPTVNRP